MKVLVLTSTFQKSKKDKVLDLIFEYCLKLKERRHEVMVVAAHTGKLPKEDEIEGIKIKRFQYFWPTSLQKLAYGFGIPDNFRKHFLAKLQVLPYVLSGSASVKKAIKEFNPDIIHAFWVLPQGLIVAIANNRKKPLIVTCFGAEACFAKKYKLGKLVKWVLEKANKTISISKKTKSELQNFYKGEIKIIPFGVDLKRFLPVGKEAKVGKGNKKIILGVGRLVERKGFEFLIRAMPLVLERENNARLLILGNGVEKEKLEELIKKLKLEDKVSVSDNANYKTLPEFYRACSVFCLPAVIDSKGDTEGQGVVILEAMASGRPVVASSVGGITDLIEHGKTGLLVREKNEKELAKALCRLLSNKKLSNKLAKNALENVERKFALERIAESYEKEYEKAIESFGNHA